MWQRAWLNLRTGNLGPFPIIVGELARRHHLRLHGDELLHRRQLRQPDQRRRAGTAMLAFGVVFVLLLGEIDLSIGYLAGIGALDRRRAPAARAAATS